MARQSNQELKLGKIAKALLITTLVIVLPGIGWSLFGWLHLLMPLVAFYTLSYYGGYTGKRVLSIAVAISLGVYLVRGDFELFAFCFILLTSGYVLFLSAERGDSPVLSGLKGSLALGIGWVALLVAASGGIEGSIYGQLLSSIDEGVVEALELYRQSSDISPETLLVIESSLHWMKVYIPLIMPSILGGFVLAITCLAMALGNLLLQKNIGKAPWPSFRYWQLPDKIIWLAIVAGLLALLSIQPFRSIGINSLILICIVYCFQGMAVTVFLLKKWKVPRLLRSLFYVMIVFQSFGTLILLILGVIDIWLDFRKLKQITVDSQK